LPIYLGVREGPTVTNVRVTYKDVIRGKASGPSSMKGAIVAGEGSGLPDYLGGRFPFTAHPLTTRSVSVDRRRSDSGA